jgi:hypothetical protein
MGIEQFFGNLAKMELFKNNQAIALKFDKRIKCDFLYFDFNSIVYTVISQIETELNYLLYEIILYANSLSKEINSRAIDIAKKWNYKINLDNKIILISDFYNFTLNITIDTIIQNIRDYLKNVIQNMVECEKLIKIYISFDGVPNMGKIIEQKKRRYNGSILRGLHKKIYAEEFDNLSLERQLYEKYKYGFDRINIIADNPLMQQVYKNLQEFYSEIKTICPKLKYYIISGPNTKGEGEKKIMEDVILYKLAGNYSIFSPDADLIILSIILHSLLADLNVQTTFSIIRYEQMTGDHGLINVNLFLDNIKKYIEDRLTKKISLNFTKINFDIAFIYTFFGNDFVPRMEAIDARKDLLVLIDKYIETIEYHSQTTDPYIIKPNGKNYSINYTKFIYFINKISLIEINMLRDKYITKNYNYNKIKKIFGSNLFLKLKEYLKLSNIIFDYVKKIKNSSDIKDLIDQLSNALTLTDTIDIFISNFLRLEKNFVDIHEKPNSSLEEKLIFIVDVLSKKDKLPSFRLNRLFEQDPELIKISLLHEKMETSNYDREIYMLEKKMGKYKELLNGNDIELGKINISVKNNKYNLYISDINKETKNYYLELFKESGSVEQYLTGIFWVFDFYVNKNNMHHNINHISTWFYPHHFAPLLYDVDVYLRTNKFILEKLNKIMITVSQHNQVNFVEFMNTFEHKLYVTPINKQKNIPEEYELFVKNEKMFPNITKIIDEIWNNRGKKYIDCRNVLYLNKCTLLTVPILPFNKFMKDLYKLRYNKKERIIYPFIKTK